MVNAAAERIYQAWLPHVGETAARAEAGRFARRFHHLIDGPLSPLPANDDRGIEAILADVATEMSAP